MIKVPISPWSNGTFKAMPSRSTYYFDVVTSERALTQLDPLRIIVWPLCCYPTTPPPKVTSFTAEIHDFTRGLDTNGIFSTAFLIF